MSNGDNPQQPFGNVTSREMDAFRSDVQNQFRAQGYEIRDIKSSMRDVSKQLHQVADRLNRITIEDEHDAEEQAEVVKAKLTRGERKWALKLVVYTVVVTVVVTNVAALIFDRLF